VVQSWGGQRSLAELTDLLSGLGTKQEAISSLATLVVPVSIAGRVSCALVVESRGRRSGWTPPLIDRLRLVGEILGGALHRRRQERTLREMLTQLERPTAQLEADNRYLQEEIKSYHDVDEIVGQSAALRVALTRLTQVASMNSTVLLLGETGTGKELFARALHDRSRRHARALVRVNCAALPPTLVESELFGHERGAFTGAHARKPGRLAQADGATVFLDDRPFLYADRGTLGNSKYERDWVTAHQHGRPFIALETWNEFHEGTNIAPSVEWGFRDYDITWPEAQHHHFLGYYVKQNYLYQLGRLPDYGGSITWIRHGYNSGPPFVRDNILNSPESRGRMSNSAYVTFLYNHYLHRAPDSGGFQHWLNLLDTGTKRTVVRDEFLISHEAQLLISNSQFVTECFRQLLRRDPDPISYNNTMNLLATGTLRSVVRDSFLNSVEIRIRDLSHLKKIERESLFDFTGWPAPFIRDR
jgi:hypothetical protein